jgi:streptogramin lyase
MPILPAVPSAAFSLHPVSCVLSRMLKARPPAVLPLLGALLLTLIAVPQAGAAGGAYTSDADFDEGSAFNVVHSTADELRLDDTVTPFGFIWVAVSTKGTVVKIDTATGAILGEYSSAPDGQPKNPSRTTVDNNGNVWAGNRDGDSVLRIGLQENGQCHDRNDNGVIDTSTGQDDVKPWTDPLGADAAGGVSTAQDECIINFVRVSSSGVRHVSVNSDNDVWVSGTGGQVFNLIDGVTGEIVRTEGSVGYGAYGGLIDPNGVIWSASPHLRWDTANPLTGPNGTNWTGLDHASYGLCIDPAGNVWETEYGPTIRKWAPDGTLLGIFNHGFEGGAQGCVVSPDGDVWVAHSLSGSSVGRLNNDGTHVGNVEVGSGPTGVAVDGNGKVWATNYNSGTVSRIDPNAGPVGGAGEVDFTTVGLGGNPYNYSDMTGSTLSGKPGTGTWSVVYDSGAAGTAWGNATWTDRLPGDSSITVRAASSADAISFGTDEAVTKGADITVADGRYLKVTMTFTRSTGGESPALEDLTVQRANELSRDRSTLAFGSRDIDDDPALTEEATVTNSGTQTVTLTGMSLAGADVNQFERLTGQAGDCTATTELAVAQTCALRTSFDPTSTGAKSATLTVTSNAADISIALTGTGTQVDTDGDGIGNSVDADDDGDGVADGVDAFPRNAAESVDTDGDGIGNNRDGDDDGDGTSDSADAFPLDATRQKPAVTPPAAKPLAESVRCASRRRFAITLRPKGVRLTSAVVRVNHKRVSIRRSGMRLRSTVDLRGLPKGTYAVTIDARDAKRRHYRETRRYRVC